MTGILFVLLLAQSTATQTDWMGGAGVPGPVSDWGTQYWRGDSITTGTEGQASLIATNWDYNAWTRHVLENDANIYKAFQGLMSEDIFHHPADIDGDGDKDIVGLVGDTAKWYDIGPGWTITEHIIGSGGAGAHIYSCIYPVDLDGDGDVDVLSATNNLGWWENDGTGNGWTWHLLESAAYHRVSAADMDGDGLLDILTANADSAYGDIYIFWNNGGSFAKTLVHNFVYDQGWRVYPADFNGDGLLDIYSGYKNTYVFLNQGSRNFTLAWSQINISEDGTWAQDIDRDGDLDLVMGQFSGSTGSFYAALNDGTGTNFTLQEIVPSNVFDYIDGAVARDIDLDGLPDIAGTHHRVGWFKQTGGLAFTLYDIDAITESHWIYADDVDGQECVPDIDLLVTDSTYHLVYENQMLQSFARFGYLESSVLDMAPSSGGGEPLWFGYQACVPNDTALAFYWRAGATFDQCTTATWQGPYYALAGVDVDSFQVQAGCSRYFQYKVEFRGDDINKDIAVLMEVWLRYNSCATEVREQRPSLPGRLSLRYGQGGLILSLPQAKELSLSLYDASGRLVQDIYHGQLPAGQHFFALKSLNKGVYFALLETSNETKKLNLVR